MTVTLDELLNDLTSDQRAALRKVGAARLNMEGASQAYAKAVAEAADAGVSFRMMERETGVTAPAIWRSLKRWREGRWREGHVD